MKGILYKNGKFSFFCQSSFVIMNWIFVEAGVLYKKHYQTAVKAFVRKEEEACWVELAIGYVEP